MFLSITFHEYFKKTNVLHEPAKRVQFTERTQVFGEWWTEHTPPQLLNVSERH